MRFAAEILADRDIFHLGRDDAAAGIVHLADVGAGPGAQHLAADVGEGLDAAASGRGRAGRYPRAGPRAAATSSTSPRPRIQSRRSSGRPAMMSIARLGVGIGAGAVVDAQRRLAGRRLEVDLAHRHAERADMDLADAADRAGGDLELGAGGDVGHVSRLQCGKENGCDARSLPTPVSAGSGSTGRRPCHAASQPLSARSPGEWDRLRPAAPCGKAPMR